MYYAMHELKYSPSQLLEMYESDYRFKSFLYGSISVKLEELEKEAKRSKGGK